jgi:hypothetical protein
MAHHLVNDPGGDAGVLQPGREGVAEVVRAVQVQSMMRPVLELHSDGLPHTSADVRDNLAQTLGVTEEDRQVPLPSGRTTRYANADFHAGCSAQPSAVIIRRAAGPSMP